MPIFYIKICKISISQMELSFNSFPPRTCTFTIIIIIDEQEYRPLIMSMYRDYRDNNNNICLGNSK